MTPPASARASGPVCEWTDLAVGYRGRTVLRALTGRVDEGEMVGIIGPNGAGKTTLLRTLGGALAPRGGRLSVGGCSPYSARRRALARYLAFVPPALNVPVTFTVREFVAMGRTPYVSAWSRLTGRDRAVLGRVLEAMDLAELAERPLDDLSSGERQRALVALALAQEPRLLLLDEPTAHLDLQHAWRLMELILRLNHEEGVTVICTSHDLNLAAQFCRRLLLLAEGRLVASGAPDEVLQPGLLSRVYEHPVRMVRLPGERAPWIMPVRAP